MIFTIVDVEVREPKFQGYAYYAIKCVDDYETSGFMLISPRAIFRFNNVLKAIGLDPIVSPSQEYPYTDEFRGRIFSGHWEYNLYKDRHYWSVEIGS